MASTVPLAIGYGLTDQEMWTMTPAEIFEAIENRAKQRMQDFRMFDTLFAGGKALYAAAHGVKDAVTADYRMFPEKPDIDDNNALEMTPDGILGRAFKNLSQAGG